MDLPMSHTLMLSLRVPYNGVQNLFYSISHVALPLTVYIATRWCCVVQLEGAASATDLCLDGWRAGTCSLPYCCSFL